MKCCATSRWITRAGFSPSGRKGLAGTNESQPENAALLRFRMRPLKTRRLDVTTNGRIPFVARVLEHLILIIQLQGKLDSPRADHYLRVLDPHLIVNRIVVGSHETLRDPHVFR